MFSFKVIGGIGIILALTACGGGGSSGNAGDTGAQPTPSPTPISTPTPPSDNEPPEAKILFPWTKSVATSGTVTVRGTASDNQGISSITVNGQQATVTPISTSASSAQKTGSATDSEVEWEIELEIPEGTTEIIVDVTDSSDQTSVEVDKATIRRMKVPIDFSLDSANNRFVGIRDQQVVDYNFVEDSQTVFGSVADALSESCFDSETNELFYLTYPEQNTYSFRSFNLSTSSNNVIHTQTFNPSLEGYVDAVFSGKLLCDENSDGLYFLTQYALESGTAKSNIYKLQLTPTVDFSLLYETDTEDDNPFIVDNLALTENFLIATSNIASYEIVSISTESGDTNPLYSYNEFSLAIVEGSTLDEIFIVHFDGIDKIDSSNTEPQNISPETGADPLEFSQVRDAVLDSSNSRIIVSDSDLDSLIAVDLVTGERTLALTSGLGEGPKLIAPRAVTLNSDLTKAYIADDGSNAAERVVEVDLNSGDRRWIGDVNNIYNVFLLGIKLDEENDILYVASHSIIYKINLASNETEIIASDSVGTGTVYEYISALELDKANNRLLFSDPVIEAIVAVNLEDFSRTVISQEGSRGTGEGFGNINGISLNSTGESVYVSNQLHGTVQQVNLETGDRTLITVSCSGFGEEESLGGLIYNPSANEILVSDDNLASIDLDTGNCEYLPNSWSLLGSDISSDNRLFFTEFGSLNLYDRTTGEKVIISK